MLFGSICPSHQGYLTHCNFWQRKEQDLKSLSILQVADIFWILNRAIWMCKYPFLNFEWGNLNVQVSTPGVASAYKPCQSLGPTPAATQSWFYNPSMTNKSQRARVFFPKCFKLHSSNLSSKPFYYSGHQVSSRLRTISTLTRKLSLSNPRYVWSNQV